MKKTLIIFDLSSKIIAPTNQSFTLIVILAFFAVLSLGCVFGAYKSNDSTNQVPPSPEPTRIGVKPEQLLGTWRGQWGHDRSDCEIEITQAQGTSFSGVLKKRGAQVAFDGTIDASSRRMTFQETKVLKLGKHYSEWSLGKNYATIAEDGSSIEGGGQDKWGEYSWKIWR